MIRILEDIDSAFGFSRINDGIRTGLVNSFRFNMENAERKNKPLDLANALHDYAAMLDFVGRFDEAKPFYEKAIQIFEEIQGPNGGKLGFIASVNEII